MSLLTHRIGLTVNVLFLAAGGVSALASEALYRIALVVIVLLLRALWARAVARRLVQAAARRERQQTLTSLADALI
jgi:hypothetical protein